MIDLSTPQEFRPVISSRRGEITAWLLSLIMFVVVLFGRSGIPSIQIGAWILFLFLFLSALMISLGNWMERQTEMQLSEQGVNFKNGLRDVQMSWKEIQRIEVQSGRINDTITVYSDNARFSFKTKGDVIYKGQVRDSMGFEQGDLIFDTILQRSGLADLEKQQGAGFYYYLRE